MKPRHPNRFHVERQQADEFRRWRDAKGNPPAADSPVIRSKLERTEDFKAWSEKPIDPAAFGPAPALRLVVTDELTKQAQAQIEDILGKPRKRAPWELRQRFPGGWVNAPYVRCARLEQV